MSAFLRWNDALADRFFNNQMAGRSVYLYITQSLIKEMEQELEPEAGKFLTTTLGGSPWATRMGICQQALQAYSGWRNKNLRFPPYIAFLCLFVLAGGTEGEFAAHAYYPRLRQLLSPVDPGKGTVPSFDRMQVLWEDLEEWSVFDRAGELGEFKARFTGGNVHIGYPLAQAMLTEQERKALPRVFYATGLDPTSPPPADELTRALRSTAASAHLQPRTVRLVANQQGGDVFGALLDIVAEELAEWDGEVETNDYVEDGPDLSFARLRICLSLDTVAGIANASVRCKVNRDFPEEGLLLEVSGLEGKFRLNEYREGWSREITHSETGELLDASLLNWQKNETMESASPNWHLHLRGQPVRVFVEGLTEALPGLIEATVLPLGQPFHIAYTKESRSGLELWFAEQCRGFREIAIVRGLPRGWHLAEVSEVLSVDLVRREFPFLSFPPAVRLRLVGGIRSGRGNNFFHFAPPDITVHGGISNLEVYCNNQPMRPLESGGAFVLSQNTRTERRITVEARNGSLVLDRISLFLTGNFSLPTSDAGLRLDGSGFDVGASGDTPSVAGALVRGSHPIQPESATEIAEDLAAQVGNVKGFLVGKKPGQVVEWPSEPFPHTWTPVWAVTRKRRKRFQAIYIGESLETAWPDQTGGTRDRTVRAWKEVLWHMRKKIQSPKSPSLRVLWKTFQKAARNV